MHYLHNWHLGVVCLFPETGKQLTIVHGCDDKQLIFLKLQCAQTSVFDEDFDVDEGLSENVDGGGCGRSLVHVAYEFGSPKLPLGV